MPAEIIAAIITAIGVVVAAVVTSSHFRPRAEKTQRGRMKIISPPAGKAVSGQVEVAGTFEGPTPPADTAFLVTATVDRKLFWPAVRERLVFRESDQTWAGSVQISTDDRLIIMVTVGAGGRALFHHYIKVADDLGQYPGIAELPPDVITQAEVLVRAANKEQ